MAGEMYACKLCGGRRESFQVFCGAACSAGWEMGQRPATPPEPTLDQTDMGRCWNCGDRKARCRCSPAHQAGPTPPEPTAPCDCEGPVHECRVPEKNPPRLIKAIPLRAPEPAAPRVTPEEWAHLREMQETAREVGERLAEVRERFGLDAPDSAAPAFPPDSPGRTNTTNVTVAPEPDEAERVAREFLDRGFVPRQYLGDLAALLRAAEARGGERGLEEAAKVADREAAYWAKRGEFDGEAASENIAHTVRKLRSGR